MVSHTRASKRFGRTFQLQTTISITWMNDAPEIGALMLLAWIGMFAAPAHAQDATRGPIVREVHFTGNEIFSDDQLQFHVRTAPNRRFLGFEGLTWWRWMYELGASGRFGARIGRVLMESGEPPAWLDEAMLASDVERLRIFYEQQGFREARVQADVDTTGEAGGAVVTFAIDAGRATWIRRVTYTGLDSLDADRRRVVSQESLLPPRNRVPGHPLQYEAADLRYSEPLLVSERQRLLTVLRNSGYAAVTRDSITAVVTPYRPDSFDVTLRVYTGPRYRFGAVHFEIQGPEEEAYPRADTLAGDRQVTWHIQNDRRLHGTLLTRSLQFRPGAWYNQSQLLSTKRRLEALGVFTFTDIRPLSTAMADGPARLEHQISVRTRPRHRFRFEAFSVQRNGVLGDGGSEIGGGLGLGYENANLFGGGEAFRLRTTASIAADERLTVFSSAQAEVTGSLTLPYLTAPFGRLDRGLDLYQARTVLSLSLLMARRDDLRLLIRGRGTARVRLEMQHSPTVTSLVDLLDVSLSNPDTLGGFENRFLDRILNRDGQSVTDPVQLAQILEDYTQPQINNAIRYSFRSARVNPLRRDRGYTHEAAIEIGGNLPYWLDAFVLTPGKTEGSLPGLPILGGADTDTRLIYRRYIRIVGDMRRYHPLNRSTVFAWKLIGGWAHPTGQARVVPFDRRFYSGGATSVRGWHLRELGPGAAAFHTETVRDDRATNILGGDIKLEASAELRKTFLQGVLAADWIIAVFTDVGNVWFGPRNPGFRNVEAGASNGRFVARRFFRELGIGSGIGVRISWEYLIMRLDLAHRVYDPAAPELGFFPRGLKRPTLYFGIGHAF